MGVNGIDGQLDVLHFAAVRNRCQLDDRVQWYLEIGQVLFKRIVHCRQSILFNNQQIKPRPYQLIYPRSRRADSAAQPDG